MSEGVREQVCYRDASCICQSESSAISCRRINWFVNNTIIIYIPWQYEPVFIFRHVEASICCPSFPLPLSLNTSVIMGTHLFFLLTFLSRLSRLFLELILKSLVCVWDSGQIKLNLITRLKYFFR